MQIAIESDCPIMAWLFINVKAGLESLNSN